jgi:Rab GDP dissociation inhibitor
MLISEPSYVAKYNKASSKGKVVRCICIMDHPVSKTKDVPSCQIILPQRQIGRKNDIFIGVLNYTHCVVKKGYYLAIISTMAETDDPKTELKPAFEIIGDVLETFITIGDLYEPVDSSFKDNVNIFFITLGIYHFFF